MRTGWRQVGAAGWESSAAVWFSQRGRDVVPECGRHTGSGADDPAKPGHRGNREQNVRDLVLTRARRQRPASTPFQADRRWPMATDTATCSRAAVLGSRADVAAGSSPSPATSSTKPSSIIASLRNVSWNLTVWPIHLRSRLTNPFHPVRRRVPSPWWHEKRDRRASSETSSMSCLLLLVAGGLSALPQATDCAARPDQVAARLPSGLRLLPSSRTRRTLVWYQGAWVGVPRGGQMPG